MNILQRKREEYLLRLLSVVTFIIFFQLYMVAPLIPGLSAYFKVSEQTVGLIVPVFLIPYGLFTLIYGILADKAGTRLIILTSFFLFAAFTLLTAISQSTSQLIFWQLLTGIGAGRVTPISLAWIGQTYPYKGRGRPLGFIFGAVAGGGALGSSAGVFLESFIGWRLLFLGVGFAAIMAFMLFIGFGIGSYLFGLALKFGFPLALFIFSMFQVILALIAFRVFKKETFTN